MFKKLLKNISEMIKYDGLTIEDMNRMAGGGGKSMPAPEAPKPFETSGTGLEGLLSKPEKTLDTAATLKKEEDVTKSKLGTRGLQIPLTANKSTTKATPAETGIQL